MGVKKKPTIKEITNVIIEMGQQLNQISDALTNIERAFSFYVEMNNDAKKFSKFLDNKVKEWKENDAKTNGDTDGDNLQGNAKD